MNNKASGHIEIIISFVIFVSFVVFLFGILPVFKNDKGGAGLEIAEKGIMNYTEAYVTYYTTLLDDAPKKECFYINNSILDKKVVLDKGGRRLKARQEGSYLYIESSERFYTLMFYEGFSESGFDSLDISKCERDKKVSFGLMRSINGLSYDKFITLKSNYEGNYSVLKSQFDIPRKEEFGFSLKTSQGVEIIGGMNEKPFRANVQSKNTPVQIIYSNGSQSSSVLNVQTW